jgi:lysophospholipase L1-like esterase
LPPATGPAQYRAFLSGVEVETTASPGPVVAAFGDSITDGYQSTPGANRRWPDRLAERLAARDANRAAAVVNTGISGNRVLSDGAITIFGQNALSRFDRDVLSIPGVTHVVVLEGVNDLGMAGNRASPPTAEALIAGYRQLIGRAHAHGLKIYGATILPYGGAGYFAPQGETVRTAVNAWIRTFHEFDGVIDLDAAIRDPAKPERMRAELQSGDWLHPNDAGYKVMGDAVDLSLFR